jgi:hypothetical protein
MHSLQIVGATAEMPFHKQIINISLTSDDLSSPMPLLHLGDFNNNLRLLIRSIITLIILTLSMDCIVHKCCIVCIHVCYYTCITHM